MFTMVEFLNYVRGDGPRWPRLFEKNIVAEISTSVFEFPNTCVGIMNVVLQHLRLRTY